MSGWPENWEKAISNKVWGVIEEQKSLWDKVSIGDFLIFYATRPVSGVIGVGRVVSKFEGKEPLWDDEIKEKKIIWKYRLSFEIIYFLPQSRWERERISQAELKPLRFQYWRGINHIDEGTFLKLLEKMRSKWSDFPGAEAQHLTSVQVMEGELEAPHKEIVEKIKEIGMMEGFVSEEEYDIDNKRLDVVWKSNVSEGDPKYVFEVELAGNFYRALAKLKHAFNKWAYPKLFLVIKREDRDKVEKLLSEAFLELKNEIRIITPGEVNELYNLEQKLNEVKKRLGIS